jgi:hypothetical protein
MSMLTRYGGLIWTGCGAVWFCIGYITGEPMHWLVACCSLVVASVWGAVFSTKY